MFLPQFRCRWPVTTSVATLHSSRVPAGSGGSVSEATGDDNSGHFDMVGPPDLVSNIRPLRLREPTSADVSMPLITCQSLMLVFSIGEGVAEGKVSDVGTEASLLDTAQHRVQAGGCLQFPS